MSNIYSSNEVEPMVAPIVKCPYLGVLYDPTTYSANRDIPNYCHKTRNLTAVSLDHQRTTCTNGSYQHCPVFASSSKRQLPSDYVNRDVSTNVFTFYTWRSPWIWAMVVISIGLLIFLVGGNRFWSALNPPMDSSNHLPVLENTNTMTMTKPVLLALTEPLILLPTHPNTITPAITMTQADLVFDKTETAQSLSLETTESANTIDVARTQTEVVYANHCESDWKNQLSVEVSGPVFTPIQTDPPQVISYGSIPFLVTWFVKNTSSDCSWASVQLQTQLSGKTRVLELMSPNRYLPIINKGFAMRDQAKILVSQVYPGQTVSILIQIDGLELIDNFGNLDKSLNLLVNGHLLTSGELTAKLDQWVVVKMPTETPQPKSGSPSNGSQPTTNQEKNTPTAGVP